MKNEKKTTILGFCIVIMGVIAFYELIWWRRGSEIALIIAIMAAIQCFMCYAIVDNNKKG